VGVERKGHKNTAENLLQAGKEIGFEVNINKTKYMVIKTN
jgi:hypothetical protein